MQRPGASWLQTVQHEETVFDSKFSFQFILRQDCTAGFFCNSDAGNTGCYLNCDPGHFLRPNFTDNTMECINEAVCPGDFDVSCADLGSDFDRNVCDPNCDGQIWVTADCRESFFCYARSPDGGM
jgi:hypothetical protein